MRNKIILIVIILCSISVFMLIYFLFLKGLNNKSNNMGNIQDNQKIVQYNKKVLMVIAPIGFRDKEFIDPKNVFDEKKIKVDVASIQKGKSVGADGMTVNIDLNISEVDVNNYDAVVFIGGPGMAKIIKDEALQVLAQKFYKANKIVAAICVSPAILAYAGILKNKKATSWDGVSDVLKKAGAIYTGELVTIDGKIITANGPEAAYQFGLKIVESL